MLYAFPQHIAPSLHARMVNYHDPAAIAQEYGAYAFQLGFRCWELYRLVASGKTLVVNRGQPARKLPIM
jgi:hypothetical protein